MARKSLFIGLAIIVLSLCCGISYATETEEVLAATNLGNQITESLNKTGDSANTAIKATTEGISNIKTEATNSINHGMNMVNDGVHNNNGSTTDTRNYNSTRTGVSGVNGHDGVSTGTRNYNATRTSTTAPMLTGMSTTTWMWVILAVAAIIIIAAIWYYATQTNNNNR